jgi:hypothetical protein
LHVGVRLIVVIAVLYGLLPGFGPTATAAVHPSSGVEPTVMVAAAPGESPSNAERGCGVTLHLCGCCVSQPVVASAVGSVLREIAPASTPAPGSEQRLARREPVRPFRPPIR